MKTKFNFLELLTSAVRIGHYVRSVVVGLEATKKELERLEKGGIE